MTVKNLINDRGNTVANQFVITDGMKTTFQSYDSEIVTIDRANHEIIFNGNMWDYSATTRKHFYKFMRDEVMTLVSRDSVQNIIKEGKYGSYWTVKTI